MASTSDEVTKFPELPPGVKEKFYGFIADKKCGSLLPQTPEVKALLDRLKKLQRTQESAGTSATTLVDKGYSDAAYLQALQEINNELIAELNKVGITRNKDNPVLIKFENQGKQELIALDGVIGEGSYGQVVYAQNVETGEWLAVKGLDCSDQNGGIETLCAEVQHEAELLNHIHEFHGTASAMVVDGKTQKLFIAEKLAPQYSLSKYIEALTEKLYTIYEPAVIPKKKTEEPTLAPGLTRSKDTDKKEVAPSQKQQQTTSPGPNSVDGTESVTSSPSSSVVYHASAEAQPMGSVMYHESAEAQPMGSVMYHESADAQPIGSIVHHESADAQPIGSDSPESATTSGAVEREALHFQPKPPDVIQLPVEHDFESRDTELADFLQKKKKLITSVSTGVLTGSILEISKIAQLLCLQAHALHSQNILHADIKPQNVHYDGKSTLQMVDWGTGIILRDGATYKLSDAPVGTVLYMSRQVCSLHYNGTRNYTHSFEPAYIQSRSSDIYAIGFSIEEMLNEVLFYKQYLQANKSDDPDENAENAIKLLYGYSHLNQLDQETGRGHFHFLPLDGFLIKGDGLRQLLIEKLNYCMGLISQLKEAQKQFDLGQPMPDLQSIAQEFAKVHEYMQEVAYIQHNVEKSGSISKEINQYVELKKQLIELKFNPSSDTAKTLAAIDKLWHDSLSTIKQLQEKTKGNRFDRLFGRNSDKMKQAEKELLLFTDLNGELDELYQKVKNADSQKTLPLQMQRQKRWLNLIATNKYTLKTYANHVKSSKDSPASTDVNMALKFIAELNTLVQAGTMPIEQAIPILRYLLRNFMADPSKVQDSTLLETLKELNTLILGDDAVQPGDTTERKQQDANAFVEAVQTGGVLAGLTQHSECGELIKSKLDQAKIDEISIVEVPNESSPVQTQSDTKEEAKKQSQPVTPRAGTPTPSKPRIDANRTGPSMLTQYGKSKQSKIPSGTELLSQDQHKPHQPPK